MNDDELTLAAAADGTEPFGDADLQHALTLLQAAAVAGSAERRAEAAISDDCDHALEVLAAAAVPPDAARREAVAGATGHTLRVLAAAAVPTDASRRVVPAAKAPIFGLQHFALAAAVCFCVGLVVLFKVAFTPPERIDVVALTNTADNAGTQAPEPDTPQPVDPDTDHPTPVDLKNPEIGLGGGTGGGGTTGGSSDESPNTTVDSPKEPVKPPVNTGGG